MSRKDDLKFSERHSKGSTIRHKEDIYDDAYDSRLGNETPPKAPDLLSLADQLAEAARRVTRQSCATAEEYNQRLDLKVALEAWDAARKGTK